MGDLHGGPGKYNFLYTYHLVTRQKTIDIADSPANDGASGAVSVTEKMPLSDVIFSYALLTAKSENVEKAAELQRIAAEKEEADKKAADLKSAATAATAARRLRSLSGL